MVEINFTYLSKIENERLDFAQFPSEELIFKLAAALETDEDELLILAKKVPPSIRDRVFERPEVFRALADCDDKTLDRVKGAWVNEMKVVVQDGKVTEYRVNMKVSFILKD